MPEQEPSRYRYLPMLPGVDGRLIADHELIGNLALIGLGRRHHTAADEAGTEVNADMNFL